MPSSERRKSSYSRRLIWLGAIIVVLFGGYSAAWFYAASKLEAVAGAAIAGLNRGSTSAACANPTARGFPFRIGLYCDGLRYANTDDKVDASAAAFRSAAQVYDPMHIVAELDSPARISGPGGSAISFDWGNLRASARLTSDFPEQLSAQVVKLSATAEAAGAGALATIGQAEAHMRRSGDDLDLAASFNGADIDPRLLGGADLPPLEGAADLSIKDGVKLARFGGSLRGHSGTIRNLSISSGGTAGLSVAGPFSVDADGLLDAELKVSIRDPKGLSALLGKAFPANAAQIEASLSGLAALGDNPSLPLRISHGRAMLGFIPLGDIPPL